MLLRYILRRRSAMLKTSSQCASKQNDDISVRARGILQQLFVQRKRYFYSKIKGRISTDDDSRNGRPKQATNHNVISEIKELLNADRILTVREI